MNEVEKKIIDLCMQKKKANENCIYESVSKDILDEFGISFSNEQIRRLSRKYRRDNNLDSNFEPVYGDERSTTILSSDGSTTSEITFGLEHGSSLTPDLLLKKHGFDTNLFELVSAKNSKWVSNKKGIGLVDMYSSKVTVRPKTSYSWSQETVDEIFKKIHITSCPQVKKIEPCKNNRYLVLPISDLHLGMLSEKNVTGNDYNLEIAESLYYYVLQDVINEVKSQNFEKIFFILGNDFINSDNINNTTTKGTPQDSSNFWHTIIDKAIEMCINGIMMLEKIAPVNVLYAVGNHDYHSMYGIMNVLKAYFRNDENVHIDIDPKERKYIKLNKVLIGVSHDLKQDRALEIMSVEAHDKWSECNTMIWLLGHLHTQMTYSKKGYVETYRLPTVSGWSRWTNQKGYTQSDKRNQSFIIDGDNGIRTIINTVIKI